MSKLPLKQRKEWAKLLFTKATMTQKEIAEAVGVTEATLSSWVRNEKERWDLLKANLVITKEQELRRIYLQINELNSYIESKEPGKRFADNKQADTLSKLAASAKQLETETSIADSINVFVEFTEWLRMSDFLKSQEFAEYMEAFIKNKLSKF